MIILNICPKQSLFTINLTMVRKINNRNVYSLLTSSDMWKGCIWMIMMILNKCDVMWLLIMFITSIWSLLVISADHRFTPTVQFMLTTKHLITKDPLLFRPGQILILSSQLLNTSEHNWLNLLHTNADLLNGSSHLRGVVALNW